MTGKPFSSHTGFFYAVLNALSANIAILDRNGVIVETNRAWRSFGRANGVQGSPDMIGVDYLALCRNTDGEGSDGAHEAAAGIESVIRGDLEEFVLDYPCHSPDQERWCYMRAIAFSWEGHLRVVVSHEDITPLKTAEETVRRREVELATQKQDLEEVNAALRALLRQRDQDRIVLEESVFSNVRQLIHPYLEKLKRSRLDEEQRVWVGLLEGRLEALVSPFLHRLSAQHFQFTPQELQVASFVREGRNTKEIAEILNISPGAVAFHRKNIRRKLGLRGKRVNLRSFLMGFRNW